MRINYIYILFTFLWFSCGKPSGNQNLRVFRYNQTEGVSSLDPAFASTQANIRIVTQLFNGLVELNESFKIQPSLANHWEISGDQLTYTFYLRDSIYFIDNECFINSTGRKFSADDFVYSFKRIMDPATSSPGAWIFKGKVKMNHNGNVSDTCFKARGPVTLKIYLEKPYPPFLSLLTMPYAFVVPEEAIKKYGKDFRSHPVGTGPFFLKAWDEGNSMALLKNNNYWESFNHKKLPLIDAVSVSFIRDKNVAFLAFVQKQFEFFSGIDENSPDVLLDENGVLKAEYYGKFRFEKRPYLNTEYLGFQLDPQNPINKNHPFLNKKIRQALNFAVDREELVNYVRYNLGKPGNSGITPFALPSFNSDSVAGYKFNADKVLQLLNEAGFPGGNGLPEFTLFTIPEYKRMTEFIVKKWNDLGFKFKVETNSSPAHHDLVNHGKVNLFRASWLGDYPDAESYLSIFYGKNFTPAGPNKTHFKNEQYDELYEKALAEKSEERRYSLYREMDRIIIEEAPVVVLYYDEVIRLTQNYVTGLEANAMNMLNLKKVDFVAENK